MIHRNTPQTTARLLKSILAILHAALLAGHLIPTVAGATTYVVSATGNDSSGDGSASHPWRTIQHAIARAAYGDIIGLMSSGEGVGHYVENITVDKSLTIQSYSSTYYQRPKVRGTDLNRPVFWVTADSVTIKDLYIENDSNWWLEAGIYLDGVTACTVKNNYMGRISLASSDGNTISGNICSHISLSGSHGNTISGNVCIYRHYYSSGIYLAGSDANTISNNVCRHFSGGGWAFDSWDWWRHPPSAGIAFWHSDENIISGNTCTRNQTGIYLEGGSDGNTVSDNICSDNEGGIFLAGSDTSGNPLLDLPTDNIIADNICNSNDYFGIFLDVSTSNVISGNTCNDNERGIFLGGAPPERSYSLSDSLPASGNTISGNTCTSNNEYGIYLDLSEDNILSSNVCNANKNGIYLDDSPNNTLLGNTCRSNDQEGMYLGSSSDNTLSGNACISNGYRGIYLDQSSNNILSRNTCTSNSNGIDLRHSSNNTISRNTCTSNRYIGILLAFLGNNTIYLNNFIANPTNAAHSGSANTWHSPTQLNYFTLISQPPFDLEVRGYSYLGNYYSDYTGSDEDNDGIGDSGEMGYELIQNADAYLLPPSVGFMAQANVRRNIPYSMPVSLVHSTDQGSTSLQAVLTYRADIIRPLGIVTDGTRTAGWDMDFNVIPGQGGLIDTLYVGMATYQDSLDDSGTLFYITMEAAPGASVGDSARLHFESIRFDEDMTAADTWDGLVIIEEPILFGDATGNGEVTTYDVAAILHHTVGLRTLTGEDSIAADVSGDSAITAFDGALVMQHTVRKISRFPVEQGGQPRIACAARTIWLGEMGRVADGRFSVPIMMDETDGVIGGEVTVSFAGDGGDVTVRGAERTSGYLLASHVRPGRLRVSFAGAESPIGSGPVLELVFDGSDDDCLRSLSLERVSLNEGRIPVRIVGKEMETPKAYHLRQNHPNPFNPETTIPYDVAKAGAVRLSIYALTGQHIRTLVDREHPVGSYSVRWNGRDDAGRNVASGVYLCGMEAGDYSAVRKMLLVR